MTLGQRGHFMRRSLKVTIFERNTGDVVYGATIESMVEIKGSEPAAVTVVRSPGGQPILAKERASTEAPNTPSKLGIAG